VLHLRDFRSHAVFEFFNTIGAKRTFADLPKSAKCQKRIDALQQLAASGAFNSIMEGLAELVAAELRLPVQATALSRFDSNSRLISETGFAELNR
jgi:hypothetical protein